MFELQDIFRLYGAQYKDNHPLSYAQSKAFSAILNCRTAELGAHIDSCQNCGFFEISYNSCRNRHCPKCQTFAKERWIENQKQNLLDVGYFHVVFTVPEQLRPIFYQNQSLMYNLLFKAAADTLQELAADKKFLGAKLGFTTILHTWGQNLSYHPHLHCVIPAGGLAPSGKWLQSKKKFFIPIKVISRVFRGKFLHYLQEANLRFLGDQAYLMDQRNFKDLVKSCYNKEWVVYCKPPFKSAVAVIDYLGRYTHRVAISNNRIISIDNDQVAFKYRDYKDNNKSKIMTLHAHEFIRRFLMHILPKGFTKIRHFGFLAPNLKAKLLTLCQFLTNSIVTTIVLSNTQLISQLIGFDISICRVCGFKKIFIAGP
jgi:predicted Zn-ribbon and HTH transcriptional regulator